MSLASLNSSGISQSNPALYQTIKDLYDQNLQLINLVNSFGFTFNTNNNELTEANSLILGGLLNLLKGQIQFPVIQNSSNDVNVLDDYEEGTWIPIDSSGAALVFGVAPIPAQYIKIGQLVLITAGILYPVTASGLQIVIGGLPFTNQATQYSASVLFTNIGFLPMGFVNISATSITFFNPATGGGVTNAVMSGKDIRFSAVYRAVN